jgi:tetratricopeptide (TPR) repeat protein
MSSNMLLHRKPFSFLNFRYFSISSHKGKIWAIEYWCFVRMSDRKEDKGSLDPKATSVAYNERGVAYFNEGNYEKAIIDFSEAISLGPSYALAYINRGGAWAQIGDYEKALADLTMSI